MSGFRADLYTDYEVLVDGSPVFSTATIARADGEDFEQHARRLTEAVRDVLGQHGRAIAEGREVRINSSRNRSYFAQVFMV